MFSGAGILRSVPLTLTVIFVHLRLLHLHLRASSKERPYEQVDARIRQFNISYVCAHPLTN